MFTINVRALCMSIGVLAWVWTPAAWSADCNQNGVEDTQDISSGTSQDCDLNGVPDECQPDTNKNGTIDACDTCGTQLTTNDTDEQWGFRQRSTSQGKVIWFDANNDIHFYNGTTSTVIQPGIEGDVVHDPVSSTVFALGSGANPGDVLAAWRRGTDLAWIWASPGTGPVVVNFTNPYDATLTMNPEDAAIGDGCIFLQMQARDPATGNLIQLPYKVDSATGNTTLLAADFLTDIQNGGTGVVANTLFTSHCKAAWSWCPQGNGGTCSLAPNLHYYDGATTTVLDTKAWAFGFAAGRLLYAKQVSGIFQLFIYDTNLPSPAPQQITNLQSTDKQLWYAKTDGRSVAMLLLDSAGKNPDIALLGGSSLTDANTRPADAAANLEIPFQFQRGQFLWTAQTGSVLYFHPLAQGAGHTISTVCGDGWLADGNIAQLLRGRGTGADSEVFLYAGTAPADTLQPTPPLLVHATRTSTTEVSLSWSTVLGASAYNIYYAQQAGVTPGNYASLPGGGTMAAVNTSPVTISGLTVGKPYFFVVTAIENAAEGPASAEAGVPACVVSTDTDNDGTPDCADGCPNDPLKTAPGTCGCGVPDTDTTGDGLPDCPADACPDDPSKTAPGLCGCGVADVDTDSDGTPDCNDQCPNDPNKTAPGTCGCGVADTENCQADACPDDPNKTQPGVCGCGVPDTDTDGDGTPNCIDQCPNDPHKTAPGTCGCGVADADSNADGILDCTVNDACPNDPNKTQPGECGCGVPDADLNGDGTVDCLETTGQEIPENGQPGCGAPGVCGTASASVLPMTALGMIAMRRAWRRRW